MRPFRGFNLPYRRVFTLCRKTITFGSALYMKKWEIKTFATENIL